MNLAELLEHYRRKREPLLKEPPTVRAGRLSELQRRINGQMMPMQPGQRPQVPPHWTGVRG